MYNKKLNIKKMKNTVFQTSWFSGETIKTTPKKLIQLAKKLDAPYIAINNGLDKTNFDFDFEASDGSYFTVYDWKYYEPLNINKVYEFHIGRNRRTNIDIVVTELKNELQKIE